MNNLRIESITATKGDAKGEVNLGWDAVEGARLYTVQYSLSGKKSSWQLADITDESKYSLKGLRSNRTYIFRVAAVNSEKQGPWTETEKKLVK